MLHHKALNIAKNPKYDGFHRGKALMVYKYFDKNASGRAIKNETMCNKELAEGLYKLIIKKLKKIKVHSSFIDRIWVVYLGDMQLITKFNKWINFLITFLEFVYCVIDIIGKYAWVIPLKDKIGIIITNGFQKILDRSHRKSIKT